MARAFLANERTQSAFYVLGLASVAVEGGVLEFRQSVWLRERVATAKQNVEDKKITS